jgi:hypothetical protein
MSGPVSPPLATTESGTATIVRPTNTLEFNGADFTVTGSGSKATISIDSTGTGAALTATQIGFGNASNLLTGSSDFTFTADTGSAGPIVLLTGNKPIWRLQDDTGATDYKSSWEQSGNSLYLYNGDSAGNNYEIHRISPDFIHWNRGNEDFDFYFDTTSTEKFFTIDSGNDRAGIGTGSPAKTLHVSDGSTTGITGGTEAAILITDDANPRIYFEDLSEGAGDKVMDIMADSEALTFNSLNDAATAYDNQNIMVVSRDNRVGIGGVPDSGVERLHVKGTSVSTDAIVRIQTESTVAQKDNYGPVIELTRTYSDGNGQDGAELARIKFMGEDDAGNVDCYGDIRMETYDAGTGSEDGVMRFYVTVGGTQTEYIRLTSRDAGSPEQKAVVINETSQDIGFRVESDGVDPALMVNSGTDNVGIGTDPDSDVQRLHVKGTTSANPVVRIETVDGGSTDGPDLELYRNSDTPNDGDDLAVIEFVGTTDDGAGTITRNVNYARITAEIIDATTGTSDARLIFKCITAGGPAQEYLRMGGQEIVFNEGSGDIDIRFESNGNVDMLKIDGGLNRVGISSAPVSGGATLQVPDNTISSYCNVNAVRSDAVAQQNMTNADCQGQTWVNDSSTAWTIFLPEGGIKGQWFDFLSTDGNMTITCQSGDTLNGVAGTTSLTRSTDYAVYRVICYANNKWALNNPE